MTATTLPCEQCGHASQTLYTWRDPTIGPEDRCQGHGILDICAECLCANGGPDYRGLTVGDLLFRLNAQRKRQPSPKPGEKGK